MAEARGRRQEEVGFRVLGFQVFRNVTIGEPQLLTFKFRAPVVNMHRMLSFSHDQ
jgi:hypothetical protein